MESWIISLSIRITHVNQNTHTDIQTYRHTNIQTYKHTDTLTLTNTTIPISRHLNTKVISKQQLNSPEH